MVPHGRHGVPESVAVSAQRSLAPTGRLPGQSVSWLPSATMVGTCLETISYWSNPTSHWVSKPLHGQAMRLLQQNCINRIRRDQVCLLAVAVVLIKVNLSPKLQYCCLMAALCNYSKHVLCNRSILVRFTFCCILLDNLFALQAVMHSKSTQCVHLLCIHLAKGVQHGNGGPHRALTIT